MLTGPCSDGRSSNANVACEQYMTPLAGCETKVPVPEAARQRSKLSLRAPSSVRRGLATTILHVTKEAITALNREITTITIDATRMNLRDRLKLQPNERRYLCAYPQFTPRRLRRVRCILQYVDWITLCAQRKRRRQAVLRVRRISRQQTLYPISQYDFIQLIENRDIGGDDCPVPASRGTEL